MLEEILFCKVCRTEYFLLYSFNDDEVIVSQSKCRCNNTKPKKLDEALKRISNEFALQGVNKIPSTTKTCN